MLVVLDTNVIVSSLLSTKGAPAKIIGCWEAGEFDVATSVALLSELERALAYPKVTKYFGNPQHVISTFLKRFAAVAILSDPKSLTVNAIKRDAPDNRVLECAEASGARYIVTGDADLLELEKFEDIIILSPTEFIRMLDLTDARRS